MSIDTTITGDTIFIVGLSLLFFIDWYLDSRIRRATDSVHWEHNREFERLSEENRQLRSEVSRLSTQVTSVELRVRP